MASISDFGYSFFYLVSYLPYCLCHIFLIYFQNVRWIAGNAASGIKVLSLLLTTRRQKTIFYWWVVAINPGCKSGLVHLLSNHHRFPLHRCREQHWLMIIGFGWNNNGSSFIGCNFYNYTSQVLLNPFCIKFLWIILK